MFFFFLFFFFIIFPAFWFSLCCLFHLFYSYEKNLSANFTLTGRRFWFFQLCEMRANIAICRLWAKTGSTTTSVNLIMRCLERKHCCLHLLTFSFIETCPDNIYKWEHISLMSLSWPIMISQVFTFWSCAEFHWGLNFVRWHFYLRAPEKTDRSYTVELQ